MPGMTSKHTDIGLRAGTGTSAHPHQWQVVVCHKHTVSSIPYAL